MQASSSKFIVYYLALLSGLALIFTVAGLIPFSLFFKKNGSESMSRFFQIATINRGSIVYIGFIIAGIIIFKKKLSFGWTICMAGLFCSTLFYCAGIFIQLKSKPDLWILLNIIVTASSFFCMILLIEKGLRKQFEVTNKNYLLAILLGFVLLVLQYFRIF
jgi:hypothetical protein